MPKQSWDFTPDDVRTARSLAYAAQDQAFKTAVASMRRSLRRAVQKPVAAARDGARIAVRNRRAPGLRFS